MFASTTVLRRTTMTMTSTRTVPAMLRRRLLAAASSSSSSSYHRRTFVSATTTLRQQQQEEKICIVGSGNFGSAMSTILGKNASALPFCHDQVNMWVFEEDFQNDKLSNIINTKHENTKYLPGYPLPPNVRAIPDLEEALHDATLLVFVLPHDFLNGALKTVQKVIDVDKCRAVSLIKALDFDPQLKRPIRMTQIIQDKIPGLQCGVLMGPNVATEVAAGQLCESTLACQFGGGNDESLNEQTRQIFHRDDTFRVQHITDVAGAEACGALKNVYALGSGFIDGLGLGGNTKASLLRVGLHEMSQFCKLYFGESVQTSTFTESCGVADLITTCYGGRNRKCAEAFAKRKLSSSSSAAAAADCKVLWKEIEEELLKGQKLQGTHTVQDVYAAVEFEGKQKDFPLLTSIYNIAFDDAPVESITDGIRIP